MKLNTTILGMLAVLMLAACNNGKGEPDTPPEPPKGQRLVKSITSTDRDNTYRADFYYQDDRIKRIEWNYSDDEEIDLATYTFEGNKIHIDADGWIQTATLNDQGYVSSIGTIGDSRVTEIAYSDNRMTRFGKTMNYTWNKGNMVSSQSQIANVGNKTYTYSNIANNPACNIDLNFINVSFEEDLDYYLVVFGYCGLRSEKLIGTVFASHGYQQVGLTYTLDKERFVTKIVYTDTKDNSTETCEIEYY